MSTAPDTTVRSPRVLPDVRVPSVLELLHPPDAGRSEHEISQLPSCELLCPTGSVSLPLSLTFQVGCKLSLVFFQYCIMANFYWLLVEGLYLHTLLVAIFSPSRRFVAYLLIGWGKDCFPRACPMPQQPPANAPCA